jgi:hypothetical protein
MGPAGAIVGPMMGNLLGGAGGAQGAQGSGGPLGNLFSEIPQAFGSLFNALDPMQRFNCPSAPFPFSPSASGIPSDLFNSPSSLMNFLTGATNKIGGGLQDAQASTQASTGGSFGGGGLANSGLNLGNIGAGLDAQMSAAVSEAQSGKMSDVLDAQQKMMQVQVTFQTLSNFIQTIGKLESEAVSNSKLT